MTHPLKVKVYSGINSLPSCYDDVFRASSQHSFFLSREWFKNFSEHIVGDGLARIYGVETPEGVPIATLPLMSSPGSLQSMSNYYSCFFGPTLRFEHDAEDVVNALVDRIWRDRDQWAVLRLQPLLRDSRMHALLENALRARGIVVQPYFCFGNWYLDLAGRNYEEYFRSLPSVLRNNIPYNLRRLERTENSRVEIITGGDRLERALDDYERVYTSSWKVPEAVPQFIRGFARVAARNGWLRLGLIYVGGEAAAAQLWIVQGSVASIYKIAYDERFAKLSVGTALTAKLMQHVIDIDKVKSVDYLSGEDDYKKNWMSDRREFWGIVAFNPRTVRGLIQIVRHVGGRAAKKTYRRLTAQK